MNRVAIAGVAMTRFGKYPDATIRSMAEQAVAETLNDAGAKPEDVECVFFANAIAGLMTGQEMIRGQVALRYTGLLGSPLINIENACASGSSAFHLAWLSVASGLYNVAMAVGSEKMLHEDKSRTFGAIGSAVDLEKRNDSGGSDKRSPFMDLYAERAAAYMERSGASPGTFAQVAVKNHEHGALNPLAQYQVRVSKEDVLASREIVPPLTLLMCSPIGDGAAAAIVCSPDAVARLGVTNPVWVEASVVVSGRDRAPSEASALQRASSQAYEKAGLGPSDLDVVEVHDAAAPAELIAYEELDLCPPGEGPALLDSGATRLGGRMPVNPSGGLLSKGHPIGATGIGQIAELVWHLRDQAGPRQVEGARVALSQNGGGNLGADPAAMAVHILRT